MRPSGDHEALLTEHQVPSLNGHDFSRVPVFAGAPDGGGDRVSCPLSPRRCPFGGACDTCPVPVQAKPAVNQPGDEYEQEDSIHMACRMEKGGLVNIRLDMLSNRPHNMTYYSLQGTEGCYESPRGFGDGHKVWIKPRHEDPNEWHDLAEFEEEFLPEKWLRPSEEALQSGHWGGDYYVVAEFLDAILEDRDPPIDVHSAMDMSLPGLVSQQSIAEGSVWLGVPDSREW